LPIGAQDAILPYKSADLETSTCCCGRREFRAILTAVAMHAVEFLLLFFIGPTLFAYTRHRVPAIPMLWRWEMLGNAQGVPAAVAAP